MKQLVSNALVTYAICIGLYRGLKLGIMEAQRGISNH